MTKDEHVRAVESFLPRERIEISVETQSQRATVAQRFLLSYAAIQKSTAGLVAVRKIEDGHMRASHSRVGRANFEGLRQANSSVESILVDDSDGSRLRIGRTVIGIQAMESLERVLARSVGGGCALELAQEIRQKA
jgi:hypothetical protein